jgi:hypothetical protein
MVNAGERSSNETSEESEGALMAKRKTKAAHAAKAMKVASSGREDPDVTWLDKVLPRIVAPDVTPQRLFGYPLEGIRLPAPELAGESTAVIARYALRYIQELAARVQHCCSHEKTPGKEVACQLLVLVASEGTILLDELAIAFQQPFREVAEVLAVFPCMFPAHPEQLRFVQERMFNDLNLGKNYAFKLRPPRGRKTFSFETWVNRLIMDYVSALYGLAASSRSSELERFVMKVPLTSKNAKVWLDQIWKMLLINIPEPENHPQLRKLGRHPSRMERAHFGERKTTRSIKDAVGKDAKHQTAGYVRAAIKEALGKYLVRMLRKEQSDK